MNRTLRCYAQGRAGEWEAICLDLDVAVQGRSFEDVYTSLREAIALYLETIADLQPDEQPSLLRRTAPLSVRLQCLAHTARRFSGEQGGRRPWHRFTLPLDA
jgi:hypothetical protein